jgi:hypothetical protein
MYISTYIENVSMHDVIDLLYDVIDTLHDVIDPNLSKRIFYHKLYI